MQQRDILKVKHLKNLLMHPDVFLSPKLHLEFAILTLREAISDIDLDIADVDPISSLWILPAAV